MTSFFISSFQLHHNLEETGWPRALSLCSANVGMPGPRPWGNHSLSLWWLLIRPALDSLVTSLLPAQNLQTADKHLSTQSLKSGVCSPRTVGLWSLLCPLCHQPRRGPRACILTWLLWGKPSTWLQKRPRHTGTPAAPSTSFPGIRLCWKSSPKLPLGRFSTNEQATFGDRCTSHNICNKIIFTLKLLTVNLKFKCNWASG